MTLAHLAIGLLLFAWIGTRAHWSWFSGVVIGGVMVAGVLASHWGLL